jgi:hypothetical protein
MRNSPKAEIERRDSAFQIPNSAFHDSSLKIHGEDAAQQSRNPKRPVTSTITSLQWQGHNQTKGKAVYGHVHDHGDVHGDEYCAQHTLERWGRLHLSGSSMSQLQQRNRDVASR